jgi:endonuclease/exonuclease/phosphatase (EEP) superfamily protein YafD
MSDPVRASSHAPAGRRPWTGLLSVQVSGWRVLELLVALLVLAVLLGYLGPLWWPLENLGVFRLQYAVLLGIAAGALALGRRFVRAAALAVLAVVQVAPLLPLWLARHEAATATGAQRLRLIVLNVHTENHDYGRTVDFIRTAHPDLVLLEEVDDAWVQALDALRGEFPFRIVEARRDNFGIALLSRRRPLSSRVHYFGDAAVPSIVAQLEVASRPLTVIGTHPVPPASAQYVRWRNGQIEALAQFCVRAATPVVLVGDLNMTERVAGFSRLLEHGRLHDSRRGFGVQATWPVQLLPFLIPLDHCLVSREVAVLDRRVGPAIGSDHYPVVVDLALR